ncbi:HAD-IA family hydrolase [Streptomyces sp. SID7909]|uniref:HAD family hydrolase n=1 Tax=Streptomyces sp. SID7909 TaxID=2706092 RepID=UPI0013BB6620|nr:HAD-IA family hydrolase [Streptomyces sp. SID7909]NEC07571.1 HAD-IA family hydrolase [Streptomyces sp. SID7909]
MTNSPFDAVLCDFDGVVRLWDPDGMAALDRRAGLPEGTLAAAAFRPALLDEAVTGRISDERWRQRVADSLAGDCGSAAAAQDLVRGWTALSGRVDADVLDLLTSLRTRVPVVLVSNATTRLEADLAALGLADAFDAVVNTARIGVAKPDHRVFEAAARTVGAEPRRCLFVDDTAGHVAAARDAGLTGHHYRGAGELRGALASMGLRPAPFTGARSSARRPSAPG